MFHPSARLPTFTYPDCRTAIPSRLTAPTMPSIGERIKRLRTDAGLTQAALAERVGLTYIQIGRYEKAKSRPSAQALTRLADALETTVDFLANGDSDHARAQLADRDLLRRFREVERLSQRDRDVVVELIDAFVTRRKLEQITG